MTKLPSLNVLKVFNTAARCGSFKVAADELCLSPSAVSHQIRVLEEHLDVVLFNRLHRSIELTQQGERYYKKVSGAINQLEQATQELLNDAGHKSITISCIPFVTNHFLIPHLPSFKANHGQYSIKLLSQIELAELKSGQVDMAVRYQRQDRDDLEYVALTQVRLAPVCSPTYWTKFQAAQKSFAQHHFISLSVDNKTWDAWLAQFYPQEAIPKFEIELDNYQAVKQATLEGLGLAMGYWPAVQDEIHSGRLISPYEDQVAEYGNMYLVYPKEDKDKESVKAVRNWLLTIFREFRVS